MEKMKRATIYINGEIAGSYGRYPNQTDSDFEDEVLETEAYCIREAYHRTNTVKSEIKYE